jgi:hypothetical protein
MSKTIWVVRFATHSGEGAYANAEGHPADRGEAVATYATVGDAQRHAEFCISKGYARAWPESRPVS